MFEPGVDCRDVVERWTLDYHGSLRSGRFSKADLRSVDSRGANLRHADLREE
ncbi:MAG: pentapeptide repeat-containing protein [Gaiellales bacterium]